MGRRARRIDVADPPFEAFRRHLDKAQKVAVPDRPAGHPIIHPDALPREIGRGPDPAVFAHIEVACGEIAQWENGQPDMAAVALVDAAKMAGHRRLAPMYRRI